MELWAFLYLYGAIYTEEKIRTWTLDVVKWKYWLGLIFWPIVWIYVGIGSLVVFWKGRK